MARPNAGKRNIALRDLEAAQIRIIAFALASAAWCAA
jgi:hypothetical protein